MNKKSRVWLEIDLKVLCDNYKKIASRVKPCSVMPVLKANAYGLGVAEIANALNSVGVNRFAVAELNEALDLSKNNNKIQIIGGVLPSEIKDAIQANIILPITDLSIAEKINDEAKKQNKVAECHFLIDTGMGRLGILAESAEQVIKEVLNLPFLNCTGIYSHFPVANEFSNSTTEKQSLLFKTILLNLAKKDIIFEEVHIANSDAVNNFSLTYGTPFNMIRTGINLYGAFDNQGKRSLDLSSVLSLKSVLTSIRLLPAGSTIGYGQTCRLKKNTLVGTVAAGYADGIPVALSNTGNLIIKDTLCPILGRVSMDYTTVSLENVINPEVENTVICLGKDQSVAISVEDWAEKKKTNSYDIICSFGNRVRRVYRDCTKKS